MSGRFVRWITVHPREAREFNDLLLKAKLTSPVVVKTDERCPQGMAWYDWSLSDLKDVLEVVPHEA